MLDLILGRDQLQLDPGVQSDSANGSVTAGSRGWINHVQQYPGNGSFTAGSSFPRTYRYLHLLLSNCFEINWNQIVYNTRVSLLNTKYHHPNDLNQTEVCLDLNESENGKYNLISVDLTQTRNWFWSAFVKWSYNAVRWAVKKIKLFGSQRPENTFKT